MSQNHVIDIPKTQHQTIRANMTLGFCLDLLASNTICGCDGQLQDKLIALLEYARQDIDGTCNDLDVLELMRENQEFCQTNETAKVAQNV